MDKNTKSDDTSESLEVYIKDNNGRILFKIINDRVMLMRLPDMSEDIKEQLICLYKEFTNVSENDLKKIRDFLDFKSNENIFCS